MEEWVVYKVDGAIDVLLHAEKELERPAGLVASREGNVGELALGVGDVLASVSISLSAVTLELSRLTAYAYVVLFKQLTGMGWPTL